MSAATIFCYVCKRHVEVHGETEADRRKQFGACGHSHQKVAQLKRGLVGAP